ncbi:metallophosphoesterase [Natronomonas halophila]|uniref:metallophosphoesterase family protein n=1 Tax=Natronomonas halophila TaxID=2747817 RepID=UPI0015B5EDD2|nr:metallophosphoesterase [Natronomonas halophila]QLD84603.1 metallophosphoesterase [Natronomonas halophila]QLD84659.1 metallophosphoesterase [Natronomonas halophila]
MTDTSDDDGRSVLGSKHTRRGVLAGLAGGSVIGMVIAANSDASGSLEAGSMLEEPHQITDGLFKGPEGAVNSTPYDVEPNVERYYVAVDTQTEWYADGDTWTKLGHGSPESKIPEQHVESHYTDKQSIGSVKIAVLSDTHYNEEGGTANDDIPGSSGWKSNLDIVIDEINAWNPDVVIHNGDLIKGNKESKSTLQYYVSTAIDYIENSGGSDGAGLNAPVHYSQGNHEYKQAGSYGADWSYEPYGYSGDSDTWYVEEYKNVDLIVLNTAYSTTDDANDHEIPQGCIDFLRSHLNSSRRPKIVFTHQPLTYTTGLAYDETVNMDEVRDLLNEDPSVHAVIYGHVHHATDSSSGLGSWDSIKQSIGPGKEHPGWWHVPHPHHLDYDTSKHPWMKIELTGSYSRVTGRIQAAYDSSTFPTEWNLGGQTQMFGGRVPHDLQLPLGKSIYFDDMSDIARMRVDESNNQLQLAADPAGKIKELLLTIAGSGGDDLLVNQNEVSIETRVNHNENEVVKEKSQQLFPQSAAASTYDANFAVADGANWDPAGTGNAALVAYGPGGSWEVIHEFSGGF